MMNNAALIEKAHDKSEQCESQPTGTGTNCCRCTVRIMHIDTLYRPLPQGILVMVYDKHGNKVMGKTNEQGISEHKGVHCGEIFWQLERGIKDKKGFYLTDGRVLIKAKNTITDIEVESGKDNDSPKMQLATPLKLEVAVNQSDITAIYLPPPIICNIRKEQPEADDLLTEEQLQQLKDSGTNATLFIHGYNVPIGTMGAFGDADNWRKRPPTSQRLAKSQRQIPFLYHTHEEITELEQIRVDKQNQIYHRSPHGLNAPTNMPQAQADYNGSLAYGWFNRAEYFLNKSAASLSVDAPISDWSKYTRIVGVTWSGDVNPESDFMQAEFNANVAGRRFARVLKQLLDNHLQINIITHSLGARVALSALNILGDFNGQYDGKIDNIFLWEPAVADNALTNDSTRDKNGLAFGVFPFAHKIPKHIRVLHSREDGVLAGDSKGGDNEWTGWLGGAYTKKYAVSIHCLERLKARFVDKMPSKSFGYSGRELEQHIRKIVKAEAEQAKQGLGKLDCLSPWSHHRYFTTDIQEEITQIVAYIYQYGREPSRGKMRPPLGHSGFDEVLNDKSDVYDEFIAEKVDKKEFYPHDQSDYFLTHSAMRDYEGDDEYFPRIYEESYQDNIMNVILGKGDNKTKSKFGQYE